MTVKTNPFNRGGVIKSELGSEQERVDKIMEMNKRGFVAVRTWERETTYLDRVATGYKKTPLRNVAEYSSKKYGVKFERVKA